MCLVAICHITWDSYIAKEGGGVCVCNFKKWERVNSCMSGESSWGIALCLQPVLSVLVGAVGILKS